ncbi:hypothetical protein [Allomuricauda sp. SCSIO 65647]|uniref:hypothetical protein n=1 Tax=Allomuricauda sp. SCSIO 65647 TaxID=2908843 RepID=UPI001F15E809|nr:hypothetical protein [Muricauda sp. SCSIO 65647]UJH67800.1 hypothetical protein L0P89_00940 [Muricauda sp. SCSIO 65647]
MKPYFIISFLLISTTVFSQDNWALVYENDAEGTAVGGSLAELILAIQNGETVRLYYNSMTPDHSDTYVEHTVLAKFITIMNSQHGRFVTAQIDPIVGQIPDFEGKQVLLKENLEWSLIASTNGKNDTMTRNVITGEIVSHQIRRWGTKWFVEKK